jgi:hypothetical protein
MMDSGHAGPNAEHANNDGEDHVGGIDIDETLPERGVAHDNALSA